MANVLTNPFFAGSAGGGGGSAALEACEITFDDNGNVTEIYEDRTLTTVFNADGSITETLVKDGKTTTLTTTFNDDGSISQVIG